MLHLQVEASRSVRRGTTESREEEREEEDARVPEEARADARHVVAEGRAELAIDVELALALHPDDRVLLGARD